MGGWPPGRTAVSNRWISQCAAVDLHSPPPFNNSTIDAFIYFKGPVGYGLDELEDALTHALGVAGEVTGTGGGEGGANLDIEFFEEIGESRALHILREALVNFSLPDSSEVVIEGRRHNLLRSGLEK